MGENVRLSLVLAAGCLFGAMAPNRIADRFGMAVAFAVMLAFSAAATAVVFA